MEIWNGDTVPDTSIKYKHLDVTSAETEVSEHWGLRRQVESMVDDEKYNMHGVNSILCKFANKTCKKPLSDPTHSPK